MRGDKSFAYDLDVQRSIVSGRVALLLRSAEIKLLLGGLSRELDGSGLHGSGRASTRERTSVYTASGRERCVWAGRVEFKGGEMDSRNDSRLQERNHSRGRLQERNHSRGAHQGGS